MQNTKAVRLGEKTTAFANIFRKTRTYFRGGTVLYRVGALEGTTFFRIVQIFPNFIVYLKNF